MAQVINLNRFRKKKAKEQKEQRAERNRRFHGRTTAERVSEEFEKRKLQKKLEGALLVPERVELDALRQPQLAFESLEEATRQVISLSEFSARLRAESTPEQTAEAARGAGEDEESES
jgi:hypothetical protein